MAKRKQDVKVTEIGTMGILFAADKKHIVDVLEIEGVISVEFLSTQYYAQIDQRYDANEIAREIESLNVETNVPEVFNE